MEIIERVGIKTCIGDQQGYVRKGGSEYVIGSLPYGPGLQ